MNTNPGLITKLRVRLTVWFVCLVMLIYAVDSAFALWLFDREFASTIKTNLVQFAGALIPEVEIDGEHASLKDWGTVVSEKHVPVLASVQLFDHSGQLTEQYGLLGIASLHNGLLRSTNLSVYSYFHPLANGSYVQVQVPTTEHDDALLKVATTKIVRIFLIAAAVGMCGWLYSGKATQPVVGAFRALRTFVDDAGHELNTPVTLIQNSLEHIEAFLNDINQPNETLDIAFRAANRLRTLSTNLLLLAKMENPDAALRPVKLDAKEVLANVVAELQTKAAAKQIDMNMGPMSELNLIADKDALSRLFSNLIDNAIRYTPEGGSIQIAAAKQESHVSITVKDTGVGIPPESLPFIFERFYRVDKARARQEGGSGLGLAIVRAIAEAHRGVVQVESNLGTGSKFTVVLPLAG
jgi:signal transduction histidine kinase